MIDNNVASTAETSENFNSLNCEKSSNNPSGSKNKEDNLDSRQLNGKSAFFTKPL